MWQHHAPTLVARLLAALAIVAWPHLGSAQSAPTGTATDAAPSEVQQRRSSENAVWETEDAFGVTVGREQLGLYQYNNVRGFSPIAAGNTRIDGLYFDPVYKPNTRVAASTTIRVGIAAQGYPFIAPTGIVDYALRKPGTSTALSGLASGDAWGSKSIEFDASTPLSGSTLALGGGAYFGRQQYNDGTHQVEANEGLELAWHPSRNIEILPFWTQTHIWDQTPSPIYLPAGNTLPPPLPGRYYSGPDWAVFHQTAGVGGVVGRAQLARHLLLSVGIFHSYVSTETVLTSLRTHLEPNGSFDQIIHADPPHLRKSDSGEILLARQFGDGPFQQRVELSVRLRDRKEGYGGSDNVDLGTFTLDQPITVPPATYTFSPTSSDHILQWSAGSAYQAAWRNVGEIGVSLIQTNYRKSVDQSGAADQTTRTKPLLLSAMGALHVTKAITAYASFAQGLEDSPAAPAPATNQGEPMPATRTRQVEGGFRWEVRPGFTAVLGGFRLQKPYFNIDSNDLYSNLGTINNEGLEFSVAGAVGSNLKVVLGYIAQTPRVSGDAVTEGLIGSRPIGIPSRQLIAYLDWRLTEFTGDSLDI
jgi:iron complex outermembrane receptor protein